MADCLRSTKAGAETPATPVTVTVTLPASAMVAQRRPGPKPRRHRATASKVSSTVLLAQRRPGPKPRRHQGRAVPRQQRVDQRSTKAGAETPATPPCLPPPQRQTLLAQRRPGPKPRRHRTGGRRSGCPPAALNEGRGRNPGDTHISRGLTLQHHRRSTKAGAETPATR